MSLVTPSKTPYKKTASPTPVRGGIAEQIINIAAMAKNLNIAEPDTTDDTNDLLKRF